MFNGILPITLLSIYLYLSSTDINLFEDKQYVPINEWWGNESAAVNRVADLDRTSYVTEAIAFNEERIVELNEQLNRSIYLTKPLEGVAFQYGFNTNELEKIISYWRHIYLPQWKERVSYFNQFQHHKTFVHGLRIHYLNIKADENIKKRPYPVLLLHGWPGSVVDFYPFIHILRATVENISDIYAFSIVVPSLPGFGWSQASGKPGLGPVQMAVIMRDLMLRLGYLKFFIHGGDFGSLIGSHIATLFPLNVLGYHSNTCTIDTTLSRFKRAFTNIFHLFLPKEKKHFFLPTKESRVRLKKAKVHFSLQSTYPDTIGIALQNNPVGLAAYILEQYLSWTNPNYRKLPDGGLSESFQLDALLDNVMIYYLTNTITTSMRIFKEFNTAEEKALQMDRVVTNTLTGCARFKNDLTHVTENELLDKYPNLIQSTYHETGGHFPALELPDTLCIDFITFVQKVERTNYYLRHSQPNLSINDMRLDWIR